ncbi:hypothetical protein LCIT_03870 [Leuconostoc citreum]|uniref:Uncharacterized protein n=1 Tax=Leuconostoc citreum TaxID=33964 RepID=A0A5A5TZS6_LEUCI|nr:hypothetical protein LCIT_03870 [Leuconostoc citreum]
MKFDIRVSGKTIKSFSNLDAANVWRDGYQSMNPDKTVIVVKDYGKVGE